MRKYIENLIAQEAVRVVSREVSPNFELASVVERSQAESSQPILFKAVTGSSLPVISNIFGSNDRLCEMIGAKPGQFCERWLELIDAANQNAPFLQLSDQDYPTKSVTLSDLPWIKWREKDDGAYITAGVFYARDPETGIGNLSFCRAAMRSNDKLVCCIDPPHDLARYQTNAEGLNQPLEVAILLGPPVEVFLAACASVPYETDEMAIAAAIRGEPIPTRRATTLNLEIPIETECVIEGRILPHIREHEGPFGEFMGYYGLPNDNGYVFEISTIYVRENAVFHALLCGGREDMSCLDIAFATRTFKTLRDTVKGVIDVSCNPMFYCTVVKIEKSYAGHANDVMNAVFAANPNYNFACIVVDKDINIHDFSDVFKAFLTRGRVDHRVKIIPDVRGWDKSPDPTYAGRIGIDATMQIGREAEFERAFTPGAETIQLNDYLD